MSGLRPPASIDLSTVDYSCMVVWLDAFEDYYSLYTDTPDEEQKCKLFLTIAGLGVRGLVRGFVPKPKTYDALKKAILDHIKPIKSVCSERHKFLSCHQLPHESVNDFVARLKNLAVSCEFDSTAVDTISNQLVRDQLIIGACNKKISESLLEGGEYTLVDAVKKANAIEQANRDMSELRSQKEAVFTARASDQASYERSVSEPKSGNARRTRPFCAYCKKQGHTIERCFKRAICGSCGRMGHTTDFCRTKNLNTCKTVSRTATGLRYVRGQLLGKDLDFLLDTGASLSILSKRLVQEFGWEHLLEKGLCSVTLADGRKLELSECMDAAVLLCGSLIVSRFFIADIPMHAILGVDVLDKLQVTINIGTEQVFSLESDILSDFNDVFDKDLKDSELRGIDCFEAIPISNEKPIRSAIRRFTAEDNVFMQEKVSELHAAGVIEVSQSPWRSCPVIVDKHDGSKRLTINYKPVNAQTTFDAFPVPDIDSLVCRLNGAKFFSKVDFSQFYHQIPLRESDRPKTAFFADGQLWQYTRLPFGLRNAVAVCSRIMHSIFDGVPNVLIYVDDLLVFAPDRETHDQTLRKVLTLIRDHGLGLNKKKCSFHLNSVDFLGFHVEDGTVKPAADRLQSLIGFPLPGDLKSLRRLIGMATYFSKYIQHFSDLLKPLLDLKNSLSMNACTNPIIDYWPPDALTSFSTIKSELSDAVLVVPSSDEELILRTDASDACIAAVLQTSSGQPVSFLSRVLTDAEKRYDIVEKEALAVYWGILRSRMFLLGRKFKVLSDHKPIQYLFNSDKVSPKLLRWRLALQEFDFQVTYCPGTENTVADCFSRINFVDFAPPTFDISYVVRAQRFDEECKLMVRAVEEKLRVKPDGVSAALWSQRKSFSVKNSVLYNDEGLIYVPPKARLKVLTLCHALHRGIAATTASVRATCFWPRLRKDVEHFVKNCRVCCFSKPNFLPPSNEPLVTKAPMEILAFDYIGPLPESSGQKYILTAIDLFSRYAFAVPVKDLSAETLIEKCKEIFSVAGFPDCVLSDRGTQFLSQNFLDFLKRFGVRKLTTQAYCPWSNGCSERFNGTLQRNMNSYLRQTNLPRFSWTRALPSALLSYRTTVHRATKCRPVDLFFGFNVKGLDVHGDRSDRPGTPRAPPNSSSVPARTDRDSRSSVPLRPGQHVLVKFPFSRKFAEKGRLGRVAWQKNQHSVRVDFADGSYVDAAVCRVCPLPESTEGLSPCSDAGSGGRDDDLGRWGSFPSLPLQPPQVTSPVLPRRSGRIRRPPRRLGIDE